MATDHPAPIDIDRIAHLARLELTPEQKQQWAPQLQSILGYVGRLAQLDTAGIDTAFQVMPQVNVFRADEVAATLPTEQALANAPDTDGVYFRMPRILE
jgi:aspartyl-tRNA(Asn)/glutamyl-tRNA(Gln) amidotransferase subunit C